VRVPSLRNAYRVCAKVYGRVSGGMDSLEWSRIKVLKTCSMA